jgi:hypothetical protein
MNASGTLQGARWFISCICLTTAFCCPFFTVLEGSRSNTLPKPCKDPKTLKTYVWYPLQTIQRHFGDLNLLHAVHLAFVHVTARYSRVWGLRTTWPYISVIMSTAAVFLDIQKAFGTLTCCINFPNCVLSASIIKLISSFLSNRIFSYGWRRNIHSPRNTSRNASRFGSGPYSV